MIVPWFGTSLFFTWYISGYLAGESLYFLFTQVESILDTHINLKLVNLNVSFLCSETFNGSLLLNEFCKLLSLTVEVFTSAQWCCFLFLQYTIYFFFPSKRHFPNLCLQNFLSYFFQVWLICYIFFEVCLDCPTSLQIS